MLTSEDSKRVADSLIANINRVSECMCNNFNRIPDKLGDNLFTALKTTDYVGAPFLSTFGRHLVKAIENIQIPITVKHG